MRHRPVAIFLACEEAALAESMRLAQAGDRQAYSLVLEHCRDAFGRLAHERCPAGFSEAEIVQRCLLTLHHARHTFDPKRSFSAWVDGIARHHGIGGCRSGSTGVRHSRIGMLVKGLTSFVAPSKGNARLKAVDISDRSDTNHRSLTFLSSRRLARLRQSILKDEAHLNHAAGLGAMKLKVEL